MIQIKLSCAEGYYVLQHIRIWRISEETHFCENGQYSRPQMDNTVHKRRNVRTHSQMGLWDRCGKECIFIVPQQSLWLLGTRADVKEHNNPSSDLSSPLLLLYSTYITLHPPFPVFSSPLFSFVSCHSLLTHSPPPVSSPVPSSPILSPCILSYACLQLLSV